VSGLRDKLGLLGGTFTIVLTATVASTKADLPGLIQKLIIPTDQRRSKPLQMTGLSLDFRLQRVSAAVEILPRPHGLAARLRNVHWNQIFDCGSQLERGELRSAWQRHRHVHMVWTAGSAAMGTLSVGP
jgi:hypothetical protein